MFGLDSPLPLFPPGMDPGKLYNPLMEMSDPRSMHPHHHGPYLKKKGKRKYSIAFTIHIANRTFTFPREGEGIREKNIIRKASNVGLIRSVRYILWRVAKQINSDQSRSRNTQKSISL